MSVRPYKVALVVIRLLVVFLPLYWVYIQVYHMNLPGSLQGMATAVIDSADTLTAFLASRLAGLLGVFSAQHGNSILIQMDSGPHVLEVDWSCNFILPFISYIAMAVALLGISVRKRMIGILGGMILIYLGNALRIAILALTGSWFGKEAMDRYHMLVFDEGMALWTMGVFLLWIHTTVGFEAVERSFD
jgi:exosortase/archaeosortase family protein